MKKSVSIVIVLLLLVVVPSVNATTGLIIKTQPEHTAYVNILEPTKTYQLIKIIKEYTGEGTFTVEFDEGSRSKVNVMIVLKKDDVRVDSETFLDIKTGGVQEIEFLPEDWVEPEVEEEVVEELVEDPATENTEEELANEVTEETTEEVPLEETADTTDASNTAPITGEVVGEDNTQSSNNIFFYAIFIVAVAGIVLFIFGYKILRAKGVVPDNSHVTFKRPKKEQKAGEVKAEEDDRTVTDRLAAAERKLKEAQAEIAQIKNRDKIEEAERKLKADQEKLEKMKRGIDFEEEPKSNVKPFRDFGDKPKF